MEPQEAVDRIALGVDERQHQPRQLGMLGAVWIVIRACGVCGLESELALDAEGDIIYG